MGFFSAKATCAICGKEVGLNRFKIGKTVDGKDIWKCPACAKLGGYVEIDLVTGKAKVETLEETEKRVKCNTCGHLYCYNGADLEANRKNARMAALNSVGAMANAVGGTQLGATMQNSAAQNYLDKIVDYSRCPKCNSSDIRILTAEEYEREKAVPTQAAAAVDPVAQIKQWKELLDMGVLTQEEFETKKKQLLGL